MTLFRKAAISLAAVSLIAAPVAASAASALGGARATSDRGQSELEGNSSWLIGLAGLLAGITAIILIADDNNDNDPVSP